MATARKITEPTEQELERAARFVDTDLAAFTITLDPAGVAFVEGYEAREDNQAKDVNPYEEDTELWTEWNLGWDAAEADVTGGEEVSEEVSEEAAEEEEEEEEAAS